MSQQLEILHFGITDWGAQSQRSQQLARALCINHQVLYVNPCYYSLYGYLRDGLRRARTRSGLRQVISVNHNLTVASFPPLLPKGLTYPALAHFNYRLLTPLIRRTAERLGFVEPVLMLSLPPDRALTGALNERLTVYDCMDRHAAFHRGGAADRLMQEERRLLEDCDVVLASSEPLRQHCAQFNHRVHLIRNGVDAEWFREKAADSGPLEELKDLRRPIIGYVGTLGPWIDLELLAQAAAAFPQATLLLVGPVQTDLTSLLQHNNVVSLGPQAYDRIPAIMDACDICLIPFKVNQLTSSVNPIKLYEYLALGKPVVSANLPELGPYREWCYLAEGWEAFVAGIGEALAELQAEPGPRRETRRRIAAENSWERRAAEIGRILAAHLAEA